MVLYLDVQFLVHFFMNYLVLRLLSGVLQRKLWKKRCALGAAAGALLACLWVLLPGKVQLRYRGIAGVLIAAAMCFLAVPMRKWSQLMLCTVYFLLGSYMLSGLAEWLLSHTFAGYLFYSAGANGGGYAALMVLVIAGAVIRRYQKRKETGLRTCWVRVHVGERSCRFRALQDTGNCLRTSTGQPVEVMERELIKSFLPELDLAITTLEKGKEPDHLQQCYLERFKCFLLPYRSAGGMGVFMTVTFQQMEVEEAWGDRVVKEPIFALQEEKLTDRKENYQGIIHL